MAQPAMKIAFSPLLACVLIATPIAGVGASAPIQAANSRSNPQSNQSSATPTSDPSLNDLVARLRAAAEKSDADLVRLRVDKWKADSANKQQSQASAESLHRNLVNALPDLIQAVLTAPSSLLANFRLYRDLNALCDKFSGLAESTGAFGPSKDYSALAADLAQLDYARQQFAERMDLLAGASDAELARLRSRPAAAAAKAPANSKVVVDDNPLPKKKRKSSPSSSQP